jgi:hypothetical protein
MKLTKHTGMLLLGVWLTATGALILLRIDFRHQGDLLAGLAILAGILILLNR